METCKISEGRQKALILVMLVFYPLIGMGVDLITPSLPAIAYHLNVSASFAKNLVGIYLLGCAFGNFVFGFLSDAYGRRKFLVIGMLAFAVFSLLPAVFPSAGMLLAARFFQGLTLGIFAVMARTIAADILPQQRLLHIMPLFATMWSIGPIIGPVIGGYLQFYFDWQACFYFFAIVGFLAFIAFLWLLPETHFKRRAFKLKEVQANFIEVITHRHYVGIILVMTFSYCILIVFGTLGPFLIQSRMGHTPVYFGHVALFFGLFFLLSTMLARYLLKRHEVFLIYRRLLPWALLAAGIMLPISFVWNENMAVLILATLVMFFTTGILYPIGMAKGISLFRHIAGSATAVLNLFNFAITALCAAVMGFIDAKTVFILCLVYFVLVLLCVGSYRFLIAAKPHIIAAT